MTSPLRGPASHPQGRGRREQAAPLAERADQAGRREPAGRRESGHAERHLQSTAQPQPAQPHAPLAAPQAEEALRAALATSGVSRSAVRYRGFVLLPQPDLGWLVRPERSPMTVLPFRTPPISLSDVKALVDWRLDGARLTPTLQSRPQR